VLLFVLNAFPRCSLLKLDAMNVVLYGLLVFKNYCKHLRGLGEEGERIMQIKGGEALGDDYYLPVLNCFSCKHLVNFM